MNTIELRQLIHELNRQDPASADFDELVSCLRIASKDTAIPLGQCSAAENFFRARISNNTKLERVADLGAPPPELILGYQRCNPPGVPMFYSAAQRLTALLEIDVKPGDIVYLSQWLPKSPVPVNYVFDPQEFASRPEASAKEVLFHSYLDTIFTRPIGESFTDSYKITAAAATVLSTRFMENTKIGVAPDGTVGLRYPSIAHSYRTHNTAFHAGFARDRLQLFHATELKIVNRRDENLDVSIIDTALESLEGRVIWTGNPASIPVPRKIMNKQEVISNGRSWVLPVFEHLPTYDEIQSFLRE